MKRKTVIFLYEFLGGMARPWLEAGFDCWLFDGKHDAGVSHSVQSNGAKLYKVGMWFKPDDIRKTVTDIVGQVFAHEPSADTRLVFGFPECTYLTVTGNRWLYHPDDKHLPTEARRPHPLHPDRRQKREEAVELALLVREVGCYLGVPWAFENPARGYLSRAFRRPDRVFHPYHFGGYLPEDDVHPFFPDIYPGRDAYPKETGIWSSDSFNWPQERAVRKETESNPGWEKCGGKSARTKEIRSCTPRGFARAVFEANRGK